MGRLPACDARDDLLLLAAELCNNAIRHTRSGQPGGWFGVQLTWARTFVRVMVTDHGPAAPAASGHFGQVTAPEGGAIAEGGDTRVSRDTRVSHDSGDSRDDLDPYDDLTGGHGLVLVADLSAAWGVGGDAAGHFVWFDMRWPGLPPLDQTPAETRNR